MTGPKEAEVAAHMSFDSIRYAQLWEDSEILHHALAVRSSDRVLSISSAGCNVLSLLLRAPQALIAVDLNPVQNAILALKLAAIRNLSHQEMIELIGLSPSQRRADLLQRLKDPRWQQLAPLWPQHSAQIEEGLPSQGRLDRFLAAFARQHISPLPGVEGLRACFAKPMLEVQKKIAPIFKDKGFKDAFMLHFSQKMLEQGRDPAQFRYVSAENIAENFYARFLAALNEQSLYANPYMHFVLFGEPLSSSLGYDYARPENFAILKGLEDRVHIHTAALEQLLEHDDAKRIDKANLSNIFEYMSQENMNGILKGLSQRMPPGGRIAFWNLLVDRDLTPELNHLFKKVKLDPSIVDRVFFYKAFHVLERRD